MVLETVATESHLVTNKSPLVCDPTTSTHLVSQERLGLGPTGARWVWLQFGAVMAPRVSSTSPLFTSPSITTFRKPLNIISWHVPCGRTTSEGKYLL